MNESIKPGALWHNRSFMLLWSGQSASQFGSAITTIVLPLFAVLALGASTFEIGLLTSASTIGFLLFGLPAGAIVERLTKRRTMLWCDVLRSVALSSIPLAVLLGGLTLAHLFVVALVMGFLTVFFEVAYQSYLPSLVSRDQLIDGNGKLGTTESLATTVGPGIAGVLISIVGGAWSIVLDGVTYMLSSISLMLIRTPEYRADTGSAFRIRGMRKEIVEGLSYTLSHPILRRLSACVVSVNLFGAVYNSIEIPYLFRVLHAPAFMIGVVVGIGGMGGILGGMVAAPFSRRFGSARIVTYPLVVIGSIGLLTPFAQPGWGVLLVSVGLAGNMAASVVFIIGAASYRQAVCPSSMLSRVAASLRWVAWGTLPLGGLLGGTLGTALGIRSTVAVAVVGCWASGFLVLLSPLRKVRDFVTPDETEIEESIAGISRAG
ncbi:MAG: MFS transporter [Pseudonocardiaceae bacterium]